MPIHSDKKGKILIAYPSSNDGEKIFSRSIIYITEHCQEGAVGFILNKPLETYVNEVVPEINREFVLYHGGPVEENKIFIVHNLPHLIPNSIPINREIHWGGDFETVIELINQGKIHASNIRFFLGYSGWDYDQLNNELDDRHWILTSQFENNSVFSPPNSNFWKKIMQKLGGEHIYWSNAPEDPNLN